MNSNEVVYKVHFKINDVSDLALQLCDDLYRPGLEYQRRQLTLYQDSDPEYARGVEATIVNMEELQRRTQVSSNEDGTLDFSFEIDHFTDKFDEQESNGIRPWLRNYVDDFFHSCVLSHLLRVQLQRERYDKIELERYNRMFDAFQEASAQAYLPKTETFWIDNELDFPNYGYNNDIT